MKSSPYHGFFHLLLVVFVPTMLQAWVLPDVFAQGTKEDYERSAGYLQRTRDRVFRDTVVPHWFGPEDSKFWYRTRTGTDSYEYVIVDARDFSRTPLDQNGIADALASELNREVDAAKLRLGSLVIADDVSHCRFRYEGLAWRYDLPRGPLVPASDENDKGTRSGLQPESEVRRSRYSVEPVRIEFENRLDEPLEYFWVMPDGQLRRYGTLARGSSLGLQTYEGHAWLLRRKQGTAVAAFVASAEHELAIIDENTVKPKPQRRRGGRRGPSPSGGTSPDGSWRVTFDDHNVVVREGDRASERVTSDGSELDRYGGPVWWSPDSSRFVVMKTIPGQNRHIHMIESSPEGSIHAELIEVDYAKPGDRVDRPRPVLFTRSDRWQGRPIDDSLFPNPYNLRDLRWDDGGNSFSFLYNERGHQKMRLITVDADTARPKLTIHESSPTFICYSSKTFLHRIDRSDELIWMSERSGWNHLYLIDADTGVVKNPITSGPWVVRKVERVDEDDRRLYINVSGIDPDQDPYHQHLIRVDLDGGNLVRLTEGDGDHRWRFSPDNRYLIDSYSRADLPPITVLRDGEDGTLIGELESADARMLFETGWRPPERFVAAGRDGKTEIHGIIVRPTDFDPSAKYPVLEAIYAGPHGAFVPKRFDLHRQLYEMAELGFIVVKLDGMGTNFRSKEFHDVCWKNLADSGFPDRIAWIRAAAAGRPEMDLSRVGIWGGSAGGQSAMRALIDHGDFYHAAVADCGCHDNRVDKIWWNEQWMGWPIGNHYEKQSNATQAHRINGDLMLIWGELDRNVDPASTMQVVNALVKADKDFQQLILPGVGHGAAGHPYAARRQQDFFVRTLWNREPRADADR